MTLFEALQQFAENNHRFRVSQKADGTIWINKTDGNFAKISPEGKYSQPKGASWRADVQAYANLAGVKLS